MSLNKYPMWSSILLRELVDSLPAEERDSLAADLQTLGHESWAAWLESHKEEIDRYAAATSAEREKRKSWQDPQHRRRLTLGAMYVHDKARRILDELTMFPCAGGPSYRKMSVYAADLAERIRSMRIPAWPYDEDGNCIYW